ncbi:molybdenum ABC transporter ATP-binding protein [Acidobacteriota bacterium]
MLAIDVEHKRDAFALRVKAELSQPVYGLYGRSGAGKTTLLHLIAGLLTPERGRIAIAGRTLFDSEKKINIPMHRRRVGVVFQDARLFPHLSVLSNLRYGIKQGRGAEQLFTIDDIIDLLELREMLDRRPRKLSGGEKQRVALGRTLMSSPRVLLLDEPLAALDGALKKQILPFLQRVRDSLSIPAIYISHDLSEVLQFTDHLLVLENGKMLGSGRYTDLAQEHAVLEHMLPTGLLNVMTMRIAGNDEEAGFTQMQLLQHKEEEETGAARLEIKGPPAGYPEGQPVSVAMRAEDIALAEAPVEAISIQNQFPAIITRFVFYQGRAVIEVDAGAPLMVSLTLGSFKRLGLEEGKSIWCLVKTNAIRILGERSSNYRKR